MTEETRTLVDAVVEHMPKATLLELPADGDLSDRYFFVATPSGIKLEDLERYLVRPRRKKAAVQVDDAPSLCTYVVRHYTNGATIYCNADYRVGTVAFVAVLNDHQPNYPPVAGSPGWADHVVTFAPKPSVEWSRWSGNSGKSMPQADFAAFIEDNMADVATSDGLPTGAQLLEMALAMEATQELRFRSSVRLQSGTQELVFVDSENDTTLQRMRLFERFSLGIAPFFRGVKYRLDARLRYRAKDGKVTFWYELIRPDLVVADAVESLVSQIGAGVPDGMPILFGRR